MAQFIWKDSFSTGIEDIDNQHKIFVEYLNECCELSTKSNFDESYSGLINKIKAYATLHFEFEENLMRAYKYPELAQQEKMHRFFETQVAELETAVKIGNREKVASLSVFLRDWFISHILDKDQNYVPFVTHS